MALSQLMRQVISGVLASLAFLILFFGLTLVWWAAFAAAVAVFVASLMVLPKGEDEAVQIPLAGAISQVDLREADRLMSEAQAKLEAAREIILSDADKSMVTEMIDHVVSIKTQVLSDPEDYRRARRFIRSYLGTMVETVERYSDLVAKSRGKQAERLQPLAQQISGFVPVLEKIDTACLENDFLSLEVQVDALAEQMKRG